VCRWRHGSHRPPSSSTRQRSPRQHWCMFWRQQHQQSHKPQCNFVQVWRVKFTREGCGGEGVNHDAASFSAEQVTRDDTPPSARHNILHPEISAAFDYPDFPRVPMEFQWSSKFFRVFHNSWFLVVLLIWKSIHSCDSIRTPRFCGACHARPTSNTVAAVSGKLPFKDRIRTSWGLAYGCALARSQA
jgi:hypothetical protein